MGSAVSDLWAAIGSPANVACIPGPTRGGAEWLCQGIRGHTLELVFCVCGLFAQNIWGLLNSTHEAQSGSDTQRVLAPGEGGLAKGTAGHAALMAAPEAGDDSVQPWHVRGCR